MDRPQQIVPEASVSFSLLHYVIVPTDCPIATHCPAPLRKLTLVLVAIYLMATCGLEHVLLEASHSLAHWRTAVLTQPHHDHQHHGGHHHRHDHHHGAWLSLLDRFSEQTANDHSPQSLPAAEWRTWTQTKPTHKTAWYASARVTFPAWESDRLRTAPSLSPPTPPPCG